MGKCNLFVLHNKIEKISELIKQFIFIPPNIWKSKFCKYHDAFMIYTNNEMLLARLSHVLNSVWLSLECARR
jgi:hypothetical protein